jgi:hypothetical protein
MTCDFITGNGFMEKKTEKTPEEVSPSISFNRNEVPKGPLLKSKLHL